MQTMVRITKKNLGDKICKFWSALGKFYQTIYYNLSQNQATDMKFVECMQKKITNNTQEEDFGFDGSHWNWTFL